MRPLSPSLLAAQKSSTREPRVQVTARSLTGGVVNLRWEPLDTEVVPDEPLALTIAGDGSMIRLRITRADDSRKLYYQRIVEPGPDSDFTQWAYAGQYNVVNCAACSLGAEVSLFWIKSDGEIDCIRSLDHGESWQSLEYAGYAPTGAVSGLAAAYKSNGDLALFFTDATTLYIVEYIAGEWQERVTWDKNTGDLTGAAAVYDVDFKLLVCGKDAAGNCKVWSIVYGDGGEVSLGVWSDLKEIASAPSESNYEFGSVFLDNPDPVPAGGGGIYRCFYVEKFSGNVPYCRPFASHTLPESSFLESLWKEPAPFEMDSYFGIAMAHDTEYAWLSSSSGVWRAKLAADSLDLSEDVLSVKVNLQEDQGDLIIELGNADRQYSHPGAGYRAVLDTGCQIDFSPGYRTASGYQFSPGLSFFLGSYEHVISPGKASLILYAADGWTTLENWTARYQFRWNKPDEYGERTTEASVKEILAQVLARCGLRLEILIASAAAADFYPDFTIHPGDGGKSTVGRLLAFISDVIFFEGNTAYLLNPWVGDMDSYSYGTDHVIQEGRYRTGFQKFNHIKLEGKEISVEVFNWPENEKHGDMVDLIEDMNIDTSLKALEVGCARLRKAEIKSKSGLLRVPVNCGQQLYDVISITDPGAGLDAAKRRVLGISLSYLPSKAEYEQKLILGAV